MTYNKPTIEVLGEAVRVIQGGKVALGTDGDNLPNAIVNPTYDLDE